MVRAARLAQPAQPGLRERCVRGASVALVRAALDEAEPLETLDDSGQPARTNTTFSASVDIRSCRPGAWFSTFHAAFPDARWEIGVLLSRGDLVAREKTVRATHLGEYAGIAPTGRTVTTSEVGIVRFRDGRMDEFWGVFDEARLMRELTGDA